MRASCGRCWPGTSACHSKRSGIFPDSAPAAVSFKLFVNEAKLVHGDLSNYNILNFNEKPVIIDVSQSVVLDNPISRELLERDINTIVHEYRKLCVKTSFEEVWEYLDCKFFK